MSCSSGVRRCTSPVEVNSRLCLRMDPAAMIACIDRVGSRTQPAAEYRRRLGEARALARLALPSAAIFGGGALMTAVETGFLGHSGTVALAGFGVGALLYTGITIVGTGVMLGLDPMMSQAIGARNDTRAGQVVWQAVWLAVIVTLL